MVILYHFSFFYLFNFLTFGKSFFLLMNGFAFLILMFMWQFFDVVLFLWFFLFLWFYYSEMRLRSFGAYDSHFLKLCNLSKSRNFFLLVASEFKVKIFGYLYFFNFHYLKSKSYSLLYLYFILLYFNTQAIYINKKKNFN